jgi:uncharacterized membrane protein (DUF485 family)
MQPPKDPTPVIGIATDVAPLTREGPKPPHELTADEDPQIVDWGKVAASEEFRGLLRDKARLIIPATLFFMLYFFSLPILVGYAPGLMETKVWNGVNIAYLFALSQFFMAWALAALYVRIARRYDRLSARIIEKFVRKEDRP